MMKNERELSMISNELARTIRHLVHVDNIPLALILPAMHGEIVACLVGAFGAEAAHECASAALRQIQVAMVPPAIFSHQGQGRCN